MSEDEKHAIKWIELYSDETDDSSYDATVRKLPLDRIDKVYLSVSKHLMYTKFVVAIRLAYPVNDDDIFKLYSLLLKTISENTHVDETDVVNIVTQPVFFKLYDILVHFRNVILPQNIEHVIDDLEELTPEEAYAYVGVPLVMVKEGPERDSSVWCNMSSGKFTSSIDDVLDSEFPSNTRANREYKEMVRLLGIRKCISIPFISIIPDPRRITIFNRVLITFQTLNNIPPNELVTKLKTAYEYIKSHTSSLSPTQTNSLFLQPIIY